MRLLAAILGFLLPLLAIAESLDDRHPLTVDDIMRTENIGRVMFHPNGQSIVYEWVPPYEQAPSLGAQGTLYDRSALSKLYSLGLNSPGQAPQPLLPQAPSAASWLSAPSPDGMQRAIYTLDAGKLRAGVFNFATAQLTMFSFTPSCCWSVQQPVWISSDKLIYAALPSGERPSVASRLGLASEIQELWQRAFGGKEPSTTILRSVSNGLADVNSFLPGELLLVDSHTGEARHLAQGYFSEIRLAPAGRYVAALKLGERIQPSPDSTLVTQLPRRSQLVVVDLQSKIALVPCLQCNVLPNTIAWSPDGQRLTFLAHHLEGDLKTTQLMEYVPADSSLTAVMPGEFQFACGISFFGQTLPVPLAAGSVVAFGHRTATAADPLFLPVDRCDMTIRDDWFLLRNGRVPHNLSGSLRHVDGGAIGASAAAIFVTGGGDVWKIPLDGHPHKLTANVPGPWHLWRPTADLPPASTPPLLAYHPDTRVVLESTDRTMLLNLDTGAQRVFPKPASELLAVDTQRHRFIGRGDSDGGSSVELSHGTLQSGTILEINKHLAQVIHSRQTTIQYRLQDENLSSCFLLPPRATATGRLPLVVFVYPDTAGECWPFSADPLLFVNLELLSAHGYAVLFAATPRHVIRTPEGPTRGMSRAVLAAVDEAVHSGYVDAARMGLFGFSQGFHEVLQVLTETDRFRAAFVGHGISDFASHYGQIALEERFGSDSSNFLENESRYESEPSSNWLAAKPWENPQRYVDNSPVFFANRIQTPLLILHGDFDSFPLAQSEEIFMALYRLRKEATYVTYWGEGHGYLSPANFRDAWQRIFEWFDTHLQSN